MRWLVAACAVSVSVSAFGSKLVVTVEHHYVARGDRSPMAAVFADERLIATVHLDVYAIPGMASTTAHAGELAALPEKWTRALHFRLANARGDELALPNPAVLSNAVRHRGPHAARAEDRDATVDCTTYTARIDLGRLQAGDYTLQAFIGGLRSAFPFSVRNGDEPEVRDAYLEAKAAKAASFAEYRELELARYRQDPSHLEPIFDALDRALAEGSLEDAKALLSLGIEKMEERRVASPGRQDFFASRVAELRAVGKALPEYFAHRSQWALSRDMKHGGYVLKDRASQEVLRDFNTANTK